MEIRWPESFALDETARARIESRLRALGQGVDGVQRVTILCRPNPAADGVEVRIEAVIRRKQFVAVRRRAELEPTMDEAIEAFASCLRLASAEEISAPPEPELAETEPATSVRGWLWGHGAIEVPRRVLAAAARLPSWERPAARGPRRASSPASAGPRVWRALRRKRADEPNHEPIVLPPVIPSYVPDGTPPAALETHAPVLHEPVEPAAIADERVESALAEPLDVEPALAEPAPRLVEALAPAVNVWRALRRKRADDPDREPIILAPVIPSYVPDGTPPAALETRVPEPAALADEPVESALVEPEDTEPAPRRVEALAPAGGVWRALRRKRADEPEREPLVLARVIPSYVPEDAHEVAVEARVPVSLEPVEPVAPSVAEPLALAFSEPAVVDEIAAVEALASAVEILPDVAEPSALPVEPEIEALAPFEPSPEPISFVAAKPLPAPVETPEAPGMRWFEQQPALEPTPTRAVEIEELATEPLADEAFPPELREAALPVYARSSPFVTGSAIAGAAVLVYLVSSPLFTIRNPAKFSAIALPAAYTAIALPPAFSAVARPRLVLDEPAAFSAWAGPAPRAELPQVAAQPPSKPRMSFTAWAKPRDTSGVRRARIGED